MNYPLYPLVAKIFSLPINRSLLYFISVLLIGVLWIIKLLIWKKCAFIEILLSIVITAITFWFIKSDIVKTVVTISIGLVCIYSIVIFVIQGLKMQTYQSKLYEYIKNNTFDFFIQTNQNDQMMDCSQSLLKMTGVAKKDTIKVPCWRFIFDHFDIITLNKKEFTLQHATDFLNGFKETSSRHQLYQFEMVIQKEDQSILYYGLIQPIYLRKTLIGRNIYFYRDRLQVVEQLRTDLKHSIEDIENERNRLHIMMSLSEGIVLYFDYETRTYVATDAFCKFTATNQQEYSFADILEMMHPDDMERYITQAETVNSISVTRLKYRLFINNQYYAVLEDSLFLNKEQNLISIIHMLGKEGELAREEPLSQTEMVDMLANLSTRNITQVLNKAENVLNTTLGEDDSKDED